MLSKDPLNSAESLLSLFREKGLMIATAESCTGGLITAALTEIAGSSAVVDRGYVTYTNEAKTEMLGVNMDVINKVGAVSPEVAEAMANGALQKSRASVSVAVTGVVGPGGSENKPAGLVYFGCAAAGQNTIVEKMNFKGDRHSVRQQTVIHAMQLATIMANQILTSSDK